MKTELYIPDVPPGQAFDEARLFGERPAVRRPSSGILDRSWQRQAVRAHLNILFRPRFHEHWVTLFQQEAEGNAARCSLWSGVSDETLRRLGGWSDRIENRLLVILSACCGLGLVTHKNNWRFTRVVESFLNLVHKEGKEVQTINSDEALEWWTQSDGELSGAFAGRVEKAWKALSKPFARRLLRRWSSEPCGFEHSLATDFAREFGIQLPQVLATLAAAATVGAMRYTGCRWVPDISAAAFAHVDDTWWKFAGE